MKHEKKIISTGLGQYWSQKKNSRNAWKLEDFTFFVLEGVLSKIALNAEPSFQVFGIFALY